MIELRPRRRRPRRGGHRSPRVLRPHSPGRAGSRRRGGLVSALRCAVGLRRSERRLPRHRRGQSSQPARSPGRGVHRRRRPSRLPTGPSDPRAAHPSGEGHLQHLYRPGVAGGHGRSVRRVARPGGSAPHRPARAPPDGHRRGRPRRGWRGGRQPDLLRHAHGAGPGSGRRGRDRRPRAGPRPAAGRRRPRRAELRRDDHPRGRRIAVGRLRVGGSARRRPGDDRCRRHSRVARSGTRRSWSTRSSTSTAARPTWSGTCAACPTRTWPSTGP